MCSLNLKTIGNSYVKMLIMKLLINKEHKQNKPVALSS